MKSTFDLEHMPIGRTIPVLTSTGDEVGILMAKRSINPDYPYIIAWVDQSSKVISDAFNSNGDGFNKNTLNIS